MRPEGRKRSGSIRWRKQVTQHGWFEYELDDHGNRVAVTIRTKKGSTTIDLAEVHSIEEDDTEEFEHE